MDITVKMDLEEFTQFMEYRKNESLAVSRLRCENGELSSMLDRVYTAILKNDIDEATVENAHEWFR